MTRLCLRWIAMLAVVAALLPMNGWGGYGASTEGEQSGCCAVIASAGMDVQRCCAVPTQSSHQRAFGEQCQWWGAWCVYGSCSGACKCCGRPDLITVLVPVAALDDGYELAPAVVAELLSCSLRTVAWVARPRLLLNTGPPRSAPESLLDHRSLLLI